VANILALLAGRNTDFDSEEELATSPQELIKQIAGKTGKAFEINIEAGDSTVDMATGAGFITMSPQFAYSGERKGLIVFAEKIYPTLNKTIGYLGLSISFIRILKIISIAFSALVLLTNDPTTTGGLLVILAAAILLLSICESLLHAVRLIRIRENFYQVHEFYPYTSASIANKSVQRGLNQFWWVGDVTRFLGF